MTMTSVDLPRDLVEHGVIVLHFDADYEHLAAADDRFRQEWVAARGSLT